MTVKEVSLRHKEFVQAGEKKLHEKSLHIYSNKKYIEIIISDEIFDLKWRNMRSLEVLI